MPGQEGNGSDPYWIRSAFLLAQGSVREELADVFAYAFLLADRYGWSVTEIVTEKNARNAEKDPVEKSKGSARKSTELVP